MYRRINEFIHLLKVSGVSGISRRYFVMNSFDGALTMLGVIVGAYVAGVVNPKTIIGVGLGASLAMGISGFSGAYMTEKAERLRKLKKLRKAMLADLDKSLHNRASRLASLWLATVDGVSPFLAAMVSITPFFLAVSNIISVEHAVLFSISLIMIVLFLLGFFLGRISKENAFLWGLRMIVAGIATAVISLLVGGW